MSLISSAKRDRVCVVRCNSITDRAKITSKLGGKGERTDRAGKPAKKGKPLEWPCKCKCDHKVFRLACDQKYTDRDHFPVKMRSKQREEERETAQHPLRQYSGGRALCNAACQWVCVASTRVSPDWMAHSGHIQMKRVCASVSEWESETQTHCTPAKWCDVHRTRKSIQIHFAN